MNGKKQLLFSDSFYVALLLNNSVIVADDKMDNNKDISQYVIKAQSGDMDAFEMLYNQSVKIFKSKIMCYLSNPQDVEDVLQEAYINIYRKPPSLKQPERFIGWGLLSVPMNH